MIYFKAILIWILMALIETLNGIFRQTTLARKVGDHRSRQIGTITGSIFSFQN